MIGMMKKFKIQVLDYYLHKPSYFLFYNILWSPFIGIVGFFFNHIYYTDELYMTSEGWARNGCEHKP